MIELEAYHFGSYVNGEERKKGRRELNVTNPYNNEVIGKISCANLEDVEEAVHTAHHVFMDTMKKMPAHERSRILRKATELLEGRIEQFAHLLALDRKSTRLNSSHVAISY